MKISKKFSDRLRYMLIKRGLTQTQLARKSGVVDSNISGYLSGRLKYPKMPNLIYICIALDVSADFMLGLTDTFAPLSK